MSNETESAVEESVNETEPLYKDLNPDEQNMDPIEVESMCPKCEENNIDDPSGNSHISSLDPTKSDPNWTLVHYTRTLEHRQILGLAEDGEQGDTPPVKEEEAQEALNFEFVDEPTDFRKEVLQVDVNCYNCGATATCDMKIVDIPKFKETVLMGTNCERCGYRTAEMKAGGGISEKGVRFKLQLQEKIDLTRDVLKSETCRIEVPELELECGMAAMSGRFTTVEGVLSAMIDELSERGSTWMGDSASASERSTMISFLDKLKAARDGGLSITLIFDDPAGNSYVQSLDDTDEDKRLLKEFYTRSYEQNDDLGLNDMNTENYLDEQQQHEQEQQRESSNQPIEQS